MEYEIVSVFVNNKINIRQFLQKRNLLERYQCFKEFQEDQRIRFGNRNLGGYGIVKIFLEVQLVQRVGFGIIGFGYSICLLKFQFYLVILDDF